MSIDKEDQRRRTHESRMLNDQLGIICITITLPEDCREDILQYTAELRAQHMMAIAAGEDMNLIRLLSRKRTGWSPKNKAHHDALAALEEGENRDRAYELRAQIVQVTEEIRIAAYETDYDKTDRLKALRVALGHSLAACLDMP